MIKLDDNLLTELGLQALPPEEKKALLKHIYETLEMRVGTTLARQMTDAQLDEFEAFINSNDEAGALRWLETNFPNYKDVVAQEFEHLKAEIRHAAPQILANSMAQQQQIAQQQYAPPAPQQGTYQQPPVQQYQHPQPVMPPQSSQYAPQHQQHPGGHPQHQQPPYDQSQYGQAA